MLRVIVFIFFTLPLISFAETRESLWSNNKKAEAVCINRLEGGNHCFIIIGNKKVDITAVENTNLGKLSVKPRNAYSKIISFPSKWLKSTEEEYVVNITTQAWFKGQRYTATEPVYIKNGAYHQR